MILRKRTIVLPSYSLVEFSFLSIHTLLAWLHWYTTAPLCQTTQKIFQRILMSCRQSTFGPGSDLALAASTTTCYYLLPDDLMGIEVNPMVGVSSRAFCVPGLVSQQHWPTDHSSWSNTLWMFSLLPSVCFWWFFFLSMHKSMAKKRKKEDKEEKIRRMFAGAYKF